MKSCSNQKYLPSQSLPTPTHLLLIFPRLPEILSPHQDRRGFPTTKDELQSPEKQKRKQEKRKKKGKIHLAIITTQFSDAYNTNYFYKIYFPLLNPTHNTLIP
jgi:hypothetical protein